MAEKLLRVALKEDRAPQESSSPVESHELCLAQQLEMDASWLPVYHLEPEHVDVIRAFVSSPEKDEERKLKFLTSIAVLFRAATYNSLCQGLDLFCQRYKLAENIKVLLEEEPRDQLHTAVWRSAMFAMTEMSFVEAVLEGKEIGLLQACFSGIFLLPPKEEMQDLKPFLYFTTMKGMDTMLVALVLNSPTSRVNEKMQSIFQMLLTFTTSERASVRERAVGRMRVLSFLLANYSSLKADPNEERHASRAEMQMPIIGQLLGHLLLLLSFKEEETGHLALDALCLLFQFKYQQHCATLTEENTQLQGDWETETTSLRTSPSATHIIESFAEYLQPSERSDIVRVFIEAMTDSSTFDKEAARNVLDMVRGNPDLWLVDVPKITSCIHKTLGCIKSVPARQSVESLMVSMADKCPQEVVTTLLQVAPGGDSTALALWEAMFSVPQTVRNILKELLSQLWDLKSRLFCTHLEDYCLVRLAMLASRDLGDRAFAATYLDFRFLKEERPAMLSLVLRAIMTLSERDEMARKMKVILPDLMRVLLFGYKAATTKALLVFRTIMAQLERREASHIAVQMAEFLLPLLDDELSQLRESSISLFRDLMMMAVGNDKREMKNVVRLGLLPLFFRLSDQTQSVAKLKQDRRRAQEFLIQSLSYLKDAQASLREAAVRFIGLAARHLRNPSKKKLAEICSALQTLAEDREPSIRSLVAQTVIIILSSSREQPRPRWTLRALCCR
ncbi:hypothetical protein Q9233_011105 [Columba guinea]|nr:hypothetical protein Q9233_011105 [Columba guinea]